jgi:hypothetical protein
MIRERIWWMRSNISSSSTIRRRDSRSRSAPWGRPAALVERGDEAVAAGDLVAHFAVSFVLPMLARGRRRRKRRPSIHSRNAPPAVETKVKSSATPAWLSAATVSPPPATETRLPSCVSAAAVLASATVAASNGGVSNAPSGPFHTRVRQFLMASASASSRRRPNIKDHLVGRDLVNVQVRTLGGLGANSLATTTS